MILGRCAASASSASSRPSSINLEFANSFLTLERAIIASVLRLDRTGVADLVFPLGSMWPSVGLAASFFSDLTEETEKEEFMVLEEGGGDNSSKQRM